MCIRLLSFNQSWGKQGKTSISRPQKTNNRVQTTIEIYEIMTYFFRLEKEKRYLKISLLYPQPIPWCVL